VNDEIEALEAQLAEALDALEAQSQGVTATPDPIQVRLEELERQLAEALDALEQGQKLQPTPTSTPRPVAVNTPTPSAPARPSGGAVACRTDSDVRDLFGFSAGEVVRTDAPWDSCKWTRQNVPSTMSFVLHDGWGLTYTDPAGQVWVTIGKGQWVSVRGFTLRQSGNQFLVEGPQGYFGSEWQFGFASERGSDTYPHCPDSNMVDLVSLTAKQQEACSVQGTMPATN